MQHTTSVNLSWYRNPGGVYRLFTPWGTFEDKTEQGCYDQLLAYAQQQPEELINALMPSQAYDVDARNQTA
jgi:hypothetical protein